MKKKKSNRAMKTLLMVFAFIFLIALILYLLKELTHQFEIIQYLIKKSNIQSEQLSGMAQEVERLNSLVHNQSNELASLHKEMKLQPVPTEKHAFSFKLQPVHIDENVAKSASLATLSGLFFLLKTVVLP